MLLWKVLNGQDIGFPVILFQSTVRRKKILTTNGHEFAQIRNWYSVHSFGIFAGPLPDFLENKNQEINLKERKERKKKSTMLYLYSYYSYY